MFTSLSALESLLINVLSKNFPLSPKEIIQKIDNLHHIKFSVPGVQKGLRELLNKGILHKHSKYYQLRTDFLLDEKHAIDRVLESYLEAHNYHLFLKEEKHYFFEYLSELDFFWNAVVEKWMNFYPTMKYSYWQQQPLPWFTLMHLDEERRAVKKFCTSCLEFKTFSAQSIINEQLKDIYTENPSSTYYLINTMKDVGHAFGIFGDHIIETKHNLETTKIIEELLHLPRKEIPISLITKLSSAGSYELIVHKDHKLATLYRERLENYLFDSLKKSKNIQ